jgi:hypothetical protein
MFSKSSTSYSYLEGVRWGIFYAVASGLAFDQVLGVFDKVGFEGGLLDNLFGSRGVSCNLASFDNKKGYKQLLMY